MRIIGKWIILPEQIHLGKAGYIYSKTIKGYNINQTKLVFKS